MLTTNINKHKAAILTPHFLSKLKSQNMKKFKTKPETQGEIMVETYRREIVQRITKNLLDIQLLRRAQAQPLWGYKIKKLVEIDFYIKLRHGALYPMLILIWITFLLLAVAFFSIKPQQAQPPPPRTLTQI